MHLHRRQQQQQQPRASMDKSVDLEQQQPLINVKKEDALEKEHEKAIEMTNMADKKKTSSNLDAAKEGEPASTQAFWLFVWMVNNILVTILNKAAFAKLDFKYPYALSTIHMVCNIAGAQIYFLLSRSVKPKSLETSHWRSVLWFSLIFSLNIAIGNTSLRYVSVNFNQVLRALVPVIVMLISILYYGKIFSLDRKLSVVPIVIGVSMAFYGDLSYTALGAFYTIMCVVLAALKAVVGGEILTGDLKLHEIDLLAKMCPLAMIQIGVVSLLTGEVQEIWDRRQELMAGPALQVVLLSGLLSFSLNVSSFIANRVTSALTLCIAANVKQVLLVLFGTLYFGDEVTAINAAGIATVFIGSFRYGYVSVLEGGR